MLTDSGTVRESDRESRVLQVSDTGKERETTSERTRSVLTHSPMWAINSLSENSKMAHYLNKANVHFEGR